ncbi:Structural maintenance of chromosomes protein 2 [Nosema bombycis CQ1]|uniref:Structural maintenance of chromosomes protein 2 n=1 Tax=Nosema bombycis (strain CQ1 / CVCC 102059) TaxID=578461 RepID=R0KQ88_NOSB1|nr:Structural maintenance of chromosomes protein 2 [Nosema bombycis CQ1]|eukprot:EOB12876.1 Structural maintenance of chromosomes protein 2 [Nosema bombycis CQ1]
MDPANFNLLEKYDHDISTLKEKINKIEKDKEKILKSITNFDSLGIKEIEKAFKHINKKLGILLRYFLPDSDAKIIVSDKDKGGGDDKVGDSSKGDDGSNKGGNKGSNKDDNPNLDNPNINTPKTPNINYELKVKIGNWKDSLLELSGGQRSLVALCLIFSMLTYKPAPFYIFDEIDAALDLNYTQSIGEIIKKEFDSAQFIVISLKNGMYDNANSVFKVFIKNGKSSIAQIK